jgi:hypothetical protein
MVGFFANIDIKFLISQEQTIGLHLYVCELLAARRSLNKCCEALQFFIIDNKGTAYNYIFLDLYECS